MTTEIIIPVESRMEKVYGEKYKETYTVKRIEHGLILERIRYEVNPNSIMDDVNSVVDRVAIREKNIDHVIQAMENLKEVQSRVNRNSLPE